jgi:hypothetical protein
MSGLANIFRDQGPLDHWQTLVAGSLAIVAALIGGYFIHRQIVAGNAIEADRLKRKFDAARAVLPLTLSTLTEYARSANEHLKLILATKNGEAIPRQSAPAAPPTVPQIVIDDLRGMIEYSDEPIRGSLRIFVGRLQIQSARLSTLTTHLRDTHDNSWSVTASNVESSILDTAEIFARCALLFKFARGDGGAMPGGPSQSDIKSALNQTGFWFEDFPRLHQSAERNYHL